MPQITNPIIYYINIIMYANLGSGELRFVSSGLHGGLKTLVFFSG